MEEPHLEPRVGNVRMFEGEKLSTKQTLMVLNGLVNLETANTVETEMVKI